jgi:hypothetical protein
MGRFHRVRQRPEVSLVSSEFDHRRSIRRQSAQSGVKRAIAVAFAKAGARVVAADINVAGAEETAAVVFSWYCSRGFPTSLH